MAAASKQEPMNPVHLYSHGSTMMLGEAHKSGEYWKKCGDEALANGIEHIIMMGAHWTTSTPNTVLVSAKPNPEKSPVAYVHPDKYVNHKLDTDLGFIPTIQEHFAAPDFDWIHDVPRDHAEFGAVIRGNVGMKGVMGGEDWELTNMCNSQFTIGDWVVAK